MFNIKNKKNTKRFLLLGDSGSGKTTFINYVTNFFYGETKFEQIISDPTRVQIAVPCKNWHENVSEQFKNKSNERNINDLTQSQTSDCFEYLFENNVLKISFIDSPGINDTNGLENDIANLKKIVKAVTCESNLNGIILLINGTNSRLSTSLANFISVLKSFLPVQMLENLTVVLTNCEEESCNFDVEKCLKDIFKFGNTYTMQNQLLRWDKSYEKLRKGTKNYEKNEISWSNSMETLDAIIRRLAEMPSLETKLFKLTEETVKKLNEHIFKHINYLLELVEKINQLSTQKESIKQAQNSMKDNSVHENTFIIEALPFYGPDVKIISNNKKEFLIEDLLNKLKIDSIGPNLKINTNINKKNKTKKMKKKEKKKLKNINKAKNNNKEKSFKEVDHSEGINAIFSKHEDLNVDEPEKLVDKNEKGIEYMQTEETQSSEKDSNNNLHEKKKLARDNFKISDNVKANNDFKMIEIEVKLPDNAAVCQYNHSEEEKVEAEKKNKKLNKEIEINLETEFQILEDKILDLKSMCVDFNFTDQFKIHLNKFEEKVNSCSTAPHLKNYFERLMKLIH